MAERAVGIMVPQVIITIILTEVAVMETIMEEIGVEL